MWQYEFKFQMVSEYSTLVQFQCGTQKFVLFTQTLKFNFINYNKDFRILIIYSLCNVVTPLIIHTLLHAHASYAMVLSYLYMNTAICRHLYSAHQFSYRALLTQARSHFESRRPHLEHTPHFKNSENLFIS